MYKLNFYVPETHIDSVKEALFDKGAGRIGQYDCCSWQVLGEGQFRPLKGSKPFLGKQNTIEKVIEYKVEMVCEDEKITDIVKELIKMHPYEEPAYEVILLSKITVE
ncbi:MAG: NGG1p interacting factor NIF3 [Methylococcaceae bacterium]|nr:NGG1p interacting factor NIF3 [Methylococcaceae bacterium]